MTTIMQKLIQSTQLDLITKHFQNPSTDTENTYITNSQLLITHIL